MNASGRAVGALARFYKILPHEILVVHDELDLPPGGVKLKRGGGAAGHNGLKDINGQLGTPDYWRGQVQMLQEQIEQMQEAPLVV